MFQRRASEQTRDCELCDSLARMHCDSDQASLCWDCDGKVHSANFLVARHCRNLLCNICQCPTPWRASGARLGPTVSVCDRCTSQSDGRVIGQMRHRQEQEEEEEIDVESNEVEEDEDSINSDDDEDEDREEGQDLEEGAGDNQVVPWSLSPLPIHSPSSSEESSSRSRSASAEPALSLKRARENADLGLQDVFPIEDESTPLVSVTLLKQRKKATLLQSSDSSSDLIRPL